MADTLKQRPEYRNLHVTQLLSYRLPAPGWVSILHRISGALLFLALPLLLWMLQCSLRSIETYTELADNLQQPVSKLFLLAMLWALMHHFCAGLRYLAIDLHLVRTLAQARSSSWVVMTASLALTIFLGVKLW